MQFRHFKIFQTLLAFPDKTIFFRGVDPYFDSGIPGLADGCYAVDIVAGASLGRAAQGRDRGDAYYRYVAGWRL